MYSLSSNDETTSDLEVIQNSGLLEDKASLHRAHKNSVRLGVKINNFNKVLLRDINKGAKSS